MRGAVPSSADVAVLGGGPAGCAAAGLLASWGVDAALVDRPRAAGAGERSLAESLPPSARRVLAATGFLPAVEAAGLHANTGNTALWRGRRRSDGFEGGAAGFHVLRRRFDGLLRAGAAARGARVVAGAVRQATPAGDGWRVEVDAAAGGGRRTIRAAWALDCTGRAGVVARRARVAERDAPTLAIVRRYAAASERGWDGVDPGHAVVESFDRGWAWSVPTSATRRHVAVMLDPGLSLAGDGAELGLSAERLDNEIARTSLMRDIVGQARAEGPAWAEAASMYSSSRYAGDRALFVGDAASFVDPMSSFGLKKALVSGWLAAVAVHTALRDPGLEDVAVEFFCAREREMYGALRQALAVEVAGHGGRADGFWRRRAAWLAEDVEAGGLPLDGAAPGLAGASGDGRPGASDAALGAGARSAFRALREGTGRLEPGTWQETRLPAVDGNRIRMARALLTPRFPEGLRYLRGVHVPQLVRMAPAGGPGELWERYSAWAERAGAPPAGMPDFLAVLAILVAEGALRLADDVAGRPPSRLEPLPRRPRS